MGRAFSPRAVMGPPTQAVGLGWYQIAPLALDGSIHRKPPFDPKVHVTEAPFHRKVWEPTVQFFQIGKNGGG